MEPIGHTTYPPFKPIMLYDGQCPFCQFWIARWRWITGTRIDYAPYQVAAELFPDILPERFARSVYLVEPTGSVYHGAHAVARALAHVPGLGWVLRVYRNAPGVAGVADGAYHWVTRHRGGLWRWTRLLWGARSEPPRHGQVTGLYLRLLGLVYLIAFGSLARQIHGLIGPDGILPAGDFLRFARIHIGAVRFWLFPTLLWLNAGDHALTLLCAGGMLCALLLIIGLMPGLMLLMLWLFYLSLSVAGQEFMNYQWDALLLEAGFLAIFMLPWRWRSRMNEEPPAALLWLNRWLLFRLMFTSGLAKLMGGDLSWRNLTALDYHFETQPLPTWLAWFFYQLPHPVLKGLTFLVLFIELAAPLLIFSPPRPRFVAFLLLLGLQLLFGLTGNYAFFGLLTVALCVLLLNDAQLAWLQPWRRWRLPKIRRSLVPNRSPLPRLILPPRAVLPRRAPRGAFQRWFTRGVATGVLALSLLLLTIQFAGARFLPRPMQGMVVAALPFRSVNTYGLFTMMTRSRPEIVIEGSDDGEDWQAYEFMWKPGELHQRPGFVWPYQPRLDWQMWFAAMDDYKSNPWMMRLMLQLLNGSPEVLALFRSNPFPEHPPRFVRATLYDYHFTDWALRRIDGQWWRRDPVGPYTPIMTLPKRNIYLEVKDEKRDDPQRIGIA